MKEAGMRMRKLTTRVGMVSAVLLGSLIAPGYAQPPSGGGSGRPTVLVNPEAADPGTATTIQEGIAMVAPGGRVVVLPGTYPEALVIDKGLTLEAIGGKSGPVIVAAPAEAALAVEVRTGEPVMIRGLTIQYRSVNGILGDGPVDLTVERTTVVAVEPRLGVSNIMFVRHHSGSGGRARLVVRESVVDGSVGVTAPPPGPPPPYPQIFGIHAAGDVDAVIERNIVRHTGGACIFVQIRLDLGGETNADVVGNDLDACHPLGRLGGSLFVSTAGGVVPSPTRPVTATGVVNVVGNTIQNTLNSCMPSAGINYEVFTGRIEHNQILGAVKPCAVPVIGLIKAGIVVGSLRGFPPIAPVVRFNDIDGNADAGVQILPNQTIPMDVTCNWWGQADGPSGLGPGTGDALVVEAGAAVPAFVPFATAPIAGSERTTCTGGAF
jgi:hypothetical protein